MNNSLLLGTALAFPRIFSSCREEDFFSLAVKTMGEFEKRRDILLKNTAGRDITPAEIMDTTVDLYSNRAIANLVLNRNGEEANRRIRHTANWFDHPHSKGRHINGESDFAAIKLCRAYYLFKNRPHLEDETREAIEHFFLTQNFESIYTSENHGFMFRVSHYLMAQQFPDQTFLAFDGRGETLYRENEQWIKDFIRFCARRGWGEFNSVGYLAVDMEILLMLFDYTADEEMKHLAGMMMDLLLADISVDSLHGMHCGAHGRIYTSSALDHDWESVMPFQYLYFGLAADKALKRSTYIDPLVSKYRPGKLLTEIAVNRPEEYENFERKHLHNTVDVRPEHIIDGSIRKYTYYTPQFVMGCVQWQDPYPEDCPGKWYAYHQQHNWDLSFAASSRARIFTHHPGAESKHNYWTGDQGCECGDWFQHKKALICLYNIPEDQVYHYIHAYLPKKEFDEINETDGFIFVRSDTSYAALKLLGEPYVWTTEGEWKEREVISNGRRNGTICEVGQMDAFGSFENFCAEIRSNRIDFDREKMKLSYHSRQNGKLTIDKKGLREVNDKQADLDYPSFRSPYMDSEWDSGLIILKKDNEKMIIDFRE